jgi:hypothetical protein
MESRAAKKEEFNGKVCSDGYFFAYADELTVKEISVAEEDEVKP